jgi:hypothetical protein
MYATIQNLFFRTMKMIIWVLCPIFFLFDIISHSFSLYFYIDDMLHHEDEHNHNSILSDFFLDGMYYFAKNGAIAIYVLAAIMTWFPDFQYWFVDVNFMAYCVASYLVAMPTCISLVTAKRIYE